MRIGRRRAAALLLTLPLATPSESRGTATMEMRDAEKVGSPCRAKQVLGGRVVRDPNTGRELFAITNMNEVSGAELILIDTERDTGELIHAPAGAGCWAIIEAPNDRLVLGTFYDGHFMVCDLKQKKFVQHARFPKEEYIWNLAYGGDGRLYGGTYPGGKLGAFDLTTGAVEDCGGPAAPNLYLRYVSPIPDGRLLCSFGTEKPTTRLYDPKTKQFAEVPKTLEGVSMGCVWNGFFVAGSRIYQGENFEPITLPFEAPPADKGGWYADVYMTSADTLFLWQGNALYRCRKGEKKLTPIATIDLRGGRCLAANAKGEVFGIRGQDYFVLRPGDTTLKLRPIPVESGPRQSLFLKCDSDGRLWGGPTFGQTLFSFDTRTRKASNTGAVCDGGGEVYDATFAGGKVYAASYAGGDITEYDPKQPWDQWGLKNPRPVTTVGPDYIRPVGGIVVGPDGKLYSGWMAKYGTYGGLVAITDLKTGTTERIENPLGAQAVSGVAVDADSLYIGTDLGANGLPQKTGESPRFGMLDLKTRKIAFSQEFPGVGQVHGLVLDGKTRRVAFIAGGKLSIFDIQKKALVTDLPSDLPKVGTSALCTSGNGRVYYGSDKSVVEVELQSGKFQRIAELPAKVNTIAVRKDGTLFVTCGADLYQVGKS